MIAEIVTISVAIPITYAIVCSIKLGLDSVKEEILPKKINTNYCFGCKYSDLTNSAVNKDKNDYLCKVHLKYVVFNGLNKNFDCPHYESKNKK